MMILLAPQIVQRLRHELRRAGRREIGGLLMGEDLGGELFRVVDISVQRSGGTQSCFIRNPKDHQKYLEEFFVRTGQDYLRFNYLGEWHSHPRFAAMPSEPDISTMQSIVGDPDVGANFLVLLIVKRCGTKMEATATGFTPQAMSFSIPLATELEEKGPEKTGVSGWLRKIFRT
jgi:integrative and conjugative element protein (TIGR02256 family)